MRLIRVLLCFFSLAVSTLKAGVMIPWPEIREIYFPYLVSQETHSIRLRSFSIPPPKYLADGTIDVGSISGRFCYFQINPPKVKKMVIWVNFNLETDLSIALQSLDKRGVRSCCIYEIIERKCDGGQQKLVSIYYSSRGCLLLEFDLYFWLKHFIYEMFPFLMSKW